MSDVQVPDPVEVGRKSDIIQAWMEKNPGKSIEEVMAYSEGVEEASRAMKGAVQVGGGNPFPFRQPDKDLLYEVAKLTQFNSCENIWWRYPEGDRTRLTVLVNCNDLFFWGCADAEEITEENLPILKQAVADVEEAVGSEYDCQADAVLLFVCRVRGMRPQGAYYQYFKVMPMVPDGLNEAGNPKFRHDEELGKVRTKALRGLFDACGPARETGMGNPKQQPKEDGAQT